MKKLRSRLALILILLSIPFICKYAWGKSTISTTASISPTSAVSEVINKTITITNSNKIKEVSATASGTSSNSSVRTLFDQTIPPDISFRTFTDASQPGLLNLGVLLDHPTDRPVSVEYKITIDSCSGGRPITISSGILVLKTGMTENYLPLPLITEEINSLTGVIEVTLSNPVNATLKDSVL